MTLPNFNKNKKLQKWMTEDIKKSKVCMIKKNRRYNLQWQFSWDWLLI